MHSYISSGSLQTWTQWIGCHYDLPLFFPLSERLDHIHVWTFCISIFFFLFLLTSAWCTVHGTWLVHQDIWTVYHAWTVTFLLFFFYCFRFLIFSKINNIQTQPKHSFKDIYDTSNHSKIQSLPPPPKKENTHTTCQSDCPQNH